MNFRDQLPMPVQYKGVSLDCGYRVDFLVEQFHGIHQAQLLTYMKLAAIPVGLLINFNVPLLRCGIRRFAL